MISISEVENLRQIKLIHSILEKDATNTSYKYALLRATIEAVQDYFHLTFEEEGRVHYPIGLIIEKWLMYFYPIFSHSKFIPQQQGESEDQNWGTRIAFRRYFQPVIDYYQRLDKNGFTLFYNDYLGDNLPADLLDEYLELIRMLRRTINDQPMRFFGKSQFDHEYSVFEKGMASKAIKSGVRLKRREMLFDLGTFTISKTLNDALYEYGGFLLGTESILYKWAFFTERQSQGGEILATDILNVLNSSPISPRSVEPVRQLYLEAIDKGEEVRCVWSNMKLNTENIEIDHMFPFSVFQNNSLWNLVPTLSKVNNSKSDKIPSRALIEKQEEQILNHWEFMNQNYPIRIRRELEVELVGKFNLNWEELKKHGLDQIMTKSEYFVETRLHSVYL